MARPVLVSKLGVYGSEPIGLYEQLQSALNAIRLSPHEINRELFLYGQKVTQKRAVIIAELNQRITQHLLQGSSVVVEPFINNPVQCRQLADIARGAGGLALPIHTRASMKLVNKRLKERYAMDQSPEAFRYGNGETMRLQDQLAVASQIMNYFQQDSVHPDVIGFEHLCLDGSEPAENLLSAVVCHLTVQSE